MPEEEVINENESEDNSGENSGGESGSESEATPGLDIASQSGQENIARAISDVFGNLHVYFHNTKVEESESNAADSATLAESYCKGGTNTRTGEDTDNAKYYYEQIASLITNFPSTDGDYILSRSQGVLSWESILDGDGGSY